MLYVIVLIIIIIAIYYFQKKPEKRKFIPINKNTRKFDVKTRNKKEKKFEKTAMLFEDADINYYKTIKLDPEEQFKFKQQNIHIPYSQSGETDVFNTMNGLYKDPNQNDTANIYDPIFDPYINADTNMYDEIFDYEEEVNPHNAIQVELYDADSQNIHDTEVCKTIRKIFNGVDVVPASDFNANDIIREIKKYAADESDKSDFDLTRINNVLDKVKSRNASISNADGATEMELLATVWKESNKKYSESRENIKEMLLTQICDTYDEKGFVLCPTGFSNRIALALIVEDPERFPKTKKIIENEILETASHIRRELEKDSDYNKMSEKEQHNIFKKELYEKLEEDYEGILSLSEIKDITNVWIDAL